LAGKECQGVILNNYFAMHQIIVAAADNPPGLTSNDNSQKKKKGHLSGTIFFKSERMINVNFSFQKLRKIYRIINNNGNIIIMTSL
jgi:hypothetical protein